MLISFDFALVMIRAFITSTEGIMGVWTVNGRHRDIADAMWVAA